MKNDNVKIEINHYMYNCSDGCCTNYGTTIKVNNVELDCQDEDTTSILQEILKHLGYNVEIIETYNNEL